MEMIVAALQEELNRAMGFFKNAKRVPAQKIRLWHTSEGGREFVFLKTGMGPQRAVNGLKSALEIIQPSHIMAIGYAGALDPGLKVGDLIAVRKALTFNLDEKNPGWEHGMTGDAYELTGYESIVASALSAGFNACPGDILTVSHIVGNPTHKRVLYESSHASIVDMETAAFAGIAASAAIPFSCIRAVSDEAQDLFLEPFSYDPAVGIPARALKLIGAGAGIYRAWKERSAIAGKSLHDFLYHYFMR
jgi:adenosylhomocysteine nucleosidase